MGNTTLLSLGPAPLTAALRYVVAAQSSNPVDLQTGLQDLIDDLIATGDGAGDLVIEGAGDGHTFAIVALRGPGGGVAVGTIARVFMGANRIALVEAYNAAVADLLTAGLEVIVHGVAGADQGTRFCGLIVAQPIPPPPP